LEDNILAPKKCCATKFLHPLENDQILLTHSPPVTGAFLTIFFQKGDQKLASNAIKERL